MICLFAPKLVCRNLNLLPLNTGTTLNVMARSLARVFSIAAAVASLASARPNGLVLETPTSSQLPRFPWADPPPYNSSIRPLVRDIPSAV